MVVGTMGASVDIERAGTADALTAVVVEGNGAAALASAVDSHGVASLPDELLVENVEHLQEGGVLFYS